MALATLCCIASIFCCRSGLLTSLVPDASEPSVADIMSTGAVRRAVGHHGARESSGACTLRWGLPRRWLRCVGVCSALGLALRRTGCLWCQCIVICPRTRIIQAALDRESPEARHGEACTATLCHWSGACKGNSRRLGLQRHWYVQHCIQEHPCQTPTWKVHAREHVLQRQ